jgi:hypothetical protein
VLREEKWYCLIKIPFSQPPNRLYKGCEFIFKLIETNDFEGLAEMFIEMGWRFYLMRRRQQD